jgi:Zn-dependent M28 family amino/carboxypeptidase
MRRLPLRRVPGWFVLLFPAALAAAPAPADDAETLRRIFAASLADGRAHANLTTLVARHPGRLSGSANLAGAIGWAEATLRALDLDRVHLQPVKVPHWERGRPESVTLLGRDGREVPLRALALGGSAATPGSDRLVAEVVEVKSLDDVTRLGAAGVAGRIVFYNRPMDPAAAHPGNAYGAAVDQRSRGPAHAGRLGAAAVLVRSMTQARDDLPQSGMTSFPAGTEPIPAVALSTVAADTLSAALAAGPVRVALQLDCRRRPDADSHNVIGEIRGREFPDRVILVGGHIDSWDIAPGAHDNGAGVVQSIEILRLFRALGLRPRHTLRCVLFTNEENGIRGSLAYAAAVKESRETHVLAVESDTGGFQPVGFNLGSTQGDAHERAAAKWRALFEPYGLHTFRRGTGGVDVGPLLVQGVTVAGLLTDSQRYFDLHHTTADGLDQVSPRELQFGAAAVAALVWLADTHGF